VIGLSRFLKGYWYLIGGGIAARVLHGRRYYATPNGKLQIDKAMLKVPVLGDAPQVGGVALHSHVRHADLLRRQHSRRPRDHGEDGGQPGDSGRDRRARASIAGGDTIAAPLQKSAVFPPMVISMIAVGEQTGGLDGCSRRSRTSTTRKWTPR
jgi:type IV pilus assembly protein PilC